MPLCPHGAPTSGPSGIVTTGRVARELPVTPALMIRQDLAQFRPLAKRITRPIHPNKRMPNEEAALSSKVTVSEAPANDAV